MTKRQIRTRDSLAAALGYVRDVKQLSPAAARLVRQLAECVAGLDNLHVEQLEVRAGRSTHALVIRRLARQLRRNHMLPIARAGKELRTWAPGAEAGLRVPHARSTPRVLVAAARRMAHVVRRYARLFRDADFPADFIKTLEAAARALHVAASRSDEVTRRQTGTTRMLARELSRGRRIVNSLEALLMARLDAEEGQWSLWRYVRRVRRRTGRPRRVHQGGAAT